jgi:Zn finger protein HypA/HybF involved in hydrogenase expression
MVNNELEVDRSEPYCPKCLSRKLTLDVQLERIEVLCNDCHHTFDYVPAGNDQSTCRDCGSSNIAVKPVVISGTNGDCTVSQFQCSDCQSIYIPATDVVERV